MDRRDSVGGDAAIVFPGDTMHRRRHTDDCSASVSPYILRRLAAYIGSESRAPMCHDMPPSRSHAPMGLGWLHAEQMACRDSRHLAVLWRRLQTSAVCPQRQPPAWRNFTENPLIAKFNEVRQR